MSIVVRPADQERDRGLLTDLLSRHFPADSVERRFDWLYQENPHGPASAWLAQEGDIGKVVGCAAVFRRRLWVSGSILHAYVLGDFCTDAGYRSLGLALQLQRACLDYVRSTSPTLAYDFPSDRMMAIYKRMQVAPSGRMVRWAKPLRADRAFSRILKTSPLRRVAAAPINTLLKCKDLASVPHKGDWTIARLDGNCGEEFTRLSHSLKDRNGWCVERSADYLNWRYWKHPARAYEMLTARRNGALAGCVVFTNTAEDSSIVDLFGFYDTSMWALLLFSVVEIVRSRGVFTLSMPVLETHPLSGLLKKLGFRPRESCPVVIYHPNGIATLPEKAKVPLYLMDGDRES